MRCTAIFDVCDTLFSTNTTIGFLRFLAAGRGDRQVAVALDRWTDRTSPAFYLGAVAYRLSRQDLARTRLIASLRGRSHDFLDDAARGYVTDILAAKIVEPVHQRLREHLRRGDRVVLASSSLDLVIAAVAEQIGVECIASRLEFLGRTCTGRLARDLTGRKAEALEQLLRPGEPVHVYTDNRSDLDLLKMAQRRTVILPRGSRARRWAGENCEYLEV